MLELVRELALALRERVLPLLGAHAQRAHSGAGESGDITFAIDSAAEELLEQFVAERAPGVAFYSEDRGLVGADGAHSVLVVDPIDGTRPALAGLESCCVSIAAAPLDGEPRFRDITHGCVVEIKSGRVFAYNFGMNRIRGVSDEVENAYWRDVGTLDAYYEANMDLCRVNPEFNLYDPEWPLRTHQVQAPPAKFVFADQGRRCGTALDSMISAGCIISGSSIRGSVLCPNVRVHSFCVVEDSILMPGVRVGRHARIRRAIVDRDVFIPRGAQVGYNELEDRKRHTVTESGIAVVTKNDEPFIGPISDDELRTEAEFDNRGSH